MKHFMLLGLAAMATIILIALPANAGAASSVFCTVQESPCPESNRWSTGTELDFSLKSGTSSSLVDTASEPIDTCKTSTAKGKIEKIEPVTGPIESLTWSSCSFPTTTLTKGKLEVLDIPGTHNGTVKADSTTEVTVNTVFFGTCVYGPTAGVDLGELKEGKPAIFVVNAVLEKLTGSNPACPKTAKWTAEYTLTEPAEKTLSVETGTLTSKSVFCTVQESPCPESNRWSTGTELDFSLKSGTKAKLVENGGEGITIDECTSSTAKGKIEKIEPVTGPIESLTWSSCSFPTTTLTKGKLEVLDIPGTHNGTVKADSTTEVTVNTVFFGTCVYGPTAGVDLGELKEGKPAIFVANAVLEKLAGSTIACPKTAKWTAEYTLTEPAEKTLSVETG